MTKRVIFSIFLCLFLLFGCGQETESLGEPESPSEEQEKTEEVSSSEAPKEDPKPSSLPMKEPLLLINPRLYPEDTTVREEELYRRLQDDLNGLTDLKEELSLSPVQEVIFDVDHLGLVIMVMNASAEEYEEISLELRIEKDKELLIEKQYDLGFRSFGALKSKEAIMVVLPLAFEHTQVFTMFSLDKFQIDLKIKE